MRVVIAVATLGAAMAHARAELPPFFELEPRPAAPALSVGAIVLDEVRYAGADERRTKVFPTVSYYHPSGFFADALNGIGFNFSRSPAYDAGLRATLDFGRDEPRALRGMGKIDTSLSPGAFFDVNVNEALQLQSTLRAGMGYEHDGVLLDLGLSCVVFARGNSGVVLDASASYANRSYMQSYYGVSARQSAASQYAAFQPDAGWHLLRAGISGQAQPDGSPWSVYGGVEATRLIGDAKHSPYVQRRSAATLYLGVSYAID